MMSRSGVQLFGEELGALSGKCAILAGDLVPFALKKHKNTYRNRIYV
jgi:hypothetical protein